MRTVHVSSLGLSASALGFGCAPLGSRVSESQGLRALACAFERGVTWYDVAPPYGDGEAEAIVGRFLVGRRDRVEICTTFGVPRPSVTPMTRFLRPVVRAMAKFVPRLRGGKKAAAPKHNVRLQAVQIENSVVESLRRLRTDYVDVLALHDPSPQDCTNELILNELQRMISKGYVRTVSIAGSPEAIIGGVRKSELYRIAQLPENPFAQALERVKDALAGDASLFFVSHSVFGLGALDRLSHLLVGDGGRLGALASQLGYGPPFMASEMLLDYAFATNPEGVVLASMFTQAHIDMNCTRAARPPRSDIGPFVQKFIVAPQA